MKAIYGARPNWLRKPMDTLGVTKAKHLKTHGYLGGNKG